MRIEDME